MVEWSCVVLSTLLNAHTPLVHGVVTWWTSHCSGVMRCVLECQQGLRCCGHWAVLALSFLPPLLRFRRGRAQSTAQGETHNHRGRPH